MKAEDMCQKNVIHSEYVGRPHWDSDGCLRSQDTMRGSDNSKTEEGNTGWGMV